MYLNPLPQKSSLFTKLKLCLGTLSMAMQYYLNMCNISDFECDESFSLIFGKEVNDIL